MKPDPIVEEVRAARAEIAAEFDFDIDRMLDRARRRAREAGRRVVSRSEPDRRRSGRQTP